MNKEDAFSHISNNEGKCNTSPSREFIAHYHLDDSHYDQLRMKFSKLSLERKAPVKNRNLEKWNQAMFCQVQSYARKSLPNAITAQSAVHSAVTMQHF